jgi:hypothetical protein
VTTLLIALVAGTVLIACVKAYHSTQLLAKDPEAWEKLQRQEDEKRRRRQELLGKATLAVTRTVGGWFRKDEP